MPQLETKRLFIAAPLPASIKTHLENYQRELKKIDADVITQIKKYAIAVASDERFRQVPAQFTFIAISNDLDNFAQKESNQRGRPKGQIYDDAELKITVWVRPWADVINDARARLQFFSNQLEYEADKDSAKAYLIKTHEKFIPNTIQQEQDEEVQPD